MKKVLFFLMAALALTTVSCKKDGHGDSTDDTVIAKPTYRVVEINKGDPKKDVYRFEWNTDGTIKTVDLLYDEKSWAKLEFTYSGKTATAKNTLTNEEVYVITLNDQKLATKIQNKKGDDFGSFETLECTYDKNGFLTSAKVNGKVNTLQVIDENGDIEWWGRIGIEDQVSESTTAPGWRKKIHTYYGTVNAAGVHGEWNEDTAAKRWLYETNLLGRASAHVMRTAWWYGVVDKDNNVVKQEYAAKLAYFPLDVDANNCVKSEKKCYDTKEKYESDPSTMSAEDPIYFVVEKI